MSSSRPRRASARTAADPSTSQSTRSPPRRVLTGASTGPSTDHNGVQVGKRPHIGELVSIWWADDQVYYPGRVTRFDTDRGEHFISYDDGETEYLDMANERWKRINPRPPVNVAAEEADTKRASPVTSAQPRKKNGKFGAMKPGTRRSHIARRGSNEPEDGADGDGVEGSGDTTANAPAAETVNAHAASGAQPAGEVIEEVMDGGTGATPPRTTRRASAIAPRPPPPLPPALPTAPAARRSLPVMVPRARPVRTAAAATKLASPGSTSAGSVMAAPANAIQAAVQPAVTSAAVAANPVAPSSATAGNTQGRPWAGSATTVHAPTPMDVDDGDLDSVGDDDETDRDYTPQTAAPAQAGAKRALPIAATAGAQTSAVPIAPATVPGAPSAQTNAPVPAAGANVVAESGEGPRKKARPMPAGPGGPIAPAAAPNPSSGAPGAGGASAQAGASGDYESRLNEILRGVTQLSSMHADLDKRFLAANLQAGRRYANTKNRYDETDRRFASITTYMISLKNNVDNLQKDVGSLHKKVDAIMASQGGGRAPVAGGGVVVNSAYGQVVNRGHAGNPRTLPGQVRTTTTPGRQLQGVTPYGNNANTSPSGVAVVGASPNPRPVGPPRRLSADRGPVRQGPPRLSNGHVESLKKRVLALMGRQVLIWVLETDHEIRGRELGVWLRSETERCMKRAAELLSKFPDYGYAQRVLQTSLSDSDVQLDWFSGDPGPQNLALARTNYDVWDPPPSNEEWKTEERLLVTIAGCFRAALNAYRVTVGESTLAACVAVANCAAINVASGVRLEQGQANAAAGGGGGAQVAVRRPVQGVPVNPAARVSQGNVVGQRAGVVAQGTTTPAGQSSAVSQAGQAGQGTAQAAAGNRPIPNGVAGTRASGSPPYSRAGGGFSPY